MRLFRIGVLSLTTALTFGCTTSGIKNGGGDAGSSGGAGNSGTGNTGGPSGGGGIKDPTAGGPTCGAKTFGLQKVPPDLLIVQDKSGSMNNTPDDMPCGGRNQSCGPMAKWPQMTAAINQVVMQTEASIRWGLKFFPESGSCGVRAMPTVPIADMNAAAIAAAIAATSPNGGTPTRIAIASASMYMATLADPNPKFLLLATDGLPNCIQGDSQASDAMGAVQAVKDSAAMGVPVFVVGIGTVAEAQTTLTDIAIAGGVPQAADPKYYPVASTADLVKVLGTIGGMIGSCSFGLGSVPPDPNNIAVTSSGTKIPPDPSHMNGWDYGTGKTSVQLYGKWCDDAKAGKLTDVKATFGCPGVIIP